MHPTDDPRSRYQEMGAPLGIDLEMPDLQSEQGSNRDSEKRDMNDAEDCYA